MLEMQQGKLLQRKSGSMTVLPPNFILMLVSVNTTLIECQAGHWPTHKGLCPGSRRKMPKPMAQWFETLPDVEASLGMIINAFRLRCEDDLQYGGHFHGCYATGGPARDFIDYLDRAEAARLFPKWWNPAKRASCVELASNRAKYPITSSMEKYEIIAAYNDNSMPMLMRMMAENIYGGGYGLGQVPMPPTYQCHCGEEEEED